jgi:hypothetical protein
LYNDQIVDYLGGTTLVGECNPEDYLKKADHDKQCDHTIKDLKEIVVRHDKVIYGEGVDKEGLLTRIGSLQLVRTIVYTGVALILTSFLAAVIGFVWRGVK